MCGGIVCVGQGWVVMVESAGVGWGTRGADACVWAQCGLADGVWMGRWVKCKGAFWGAAAAVADRGTGTGVRQWQQQPWGPASLARLVLCRAPGPTPPSPSRACKHSC